MFNISPLFSLFKVYYHNFPGKNTRSRERTRPPLPHFRLSLAPLIFKSEKIPAFHQFSFDFFENTSILKGMFRASLSSRGLGHRVFIPATRVRIPMGMPFLQKRRTRVEFVLETEAGQSIGLLRFLCPCAAGSVSPPPRPDPPPPKVLLFIKLFFVQNKNIHKKNSFQLTFQKKQFIIMGGIVCP